MIVRNILSRVKLLFSNEKKLYSSLFKLTGCRPNKIELYKIALTHKSQTVRQKGRSVNNERLEFLGDAVLETVVSDMVFRHYPKKSEGFLTNLRSRIVCRDSLNKVADSIGLTRYVSVSHDQSSPHNNVGGNALEALIGALYLDLGFRACRKFVIGRILPALGSLEQISEEEVNFKSKLVEWCQKNRIRLEFTLKQREGTNDNAPLFVSKVLLEGCIAGSGNGYSKKEAHQQAAKEVLALLRRKPKYAEIIKKRRDEHAAAEPAADKPSRRKGRSTAPAPAASAASGSDTEKQLPAEIKPQPTAVVKSAREKKVPQVAAEVTSMSVPQPAAPAPAAAKPAKPVAAADKPAPAPAAAKPAKPVAAADKPAPAPAAAKPAKPAAPAAKPAAVSAPAAAKPAKPAAPAEKTAPKTERPAAVKSADKPAGRTEHTETPKAEKPARKPRQRAAKADERTTSAAEQAENKRREHIIRQAEEAAFAEHAD